MWEAGAATEGDARPLGSSGPAATYLLDGDQLRLRLDTRGDVVGALPHRDVVEGLFDLLAVLHDQLELVVASAARRRRRLDGDRSPAGPPSSALTASPACLRRRAVRLGDRRVAAVTVVAADADDVGGTASVQEVPVHRVRQVRPLDELAEVLGELRPVRDQRGFVDRPSLGEADERGDGGADAFIGFEPDDTSSM